MKYKAGDKVRVRKDLILGEKYGDFYSGIGMEEYKGKEAIIECVIGDTYRINLDDEYYWWTDEMLEPVVENGQKEEKVRSKADNLQKKILNLEILLL